MSVTPTPRQPSGLGKAGRALWRRLTAEYELEPGELVLLELACRQCDDVAALEAVLEEGGIVTKGSTGQPVVSRAVSEVRQGRAAVARLLGQIGLPSAEAAAAEGPSEAESAASRRARNAAEKRWANVAKLPRGKGA